MSDFNKYLRNIAPTKKGVSVLLLCLLVIPCMVDAVLFLTVTSRTGEVMQMSGFLLSAYLRYFPLLVAYLFVFFLVSQLYKKIRGSKEL